MARWTEEEAKNYGFWKDSNGQWHQPSNQNSSVEQGIQSRNTGKVPKPKPNVQRKTANKVKKQKEVKRSSKEGDRYKIIITERRMSDMDPDNLCPKYYIDEIVRAGILPDDSSKYVVSVEKKVIKAKSKEAEATLIEVFKRV